MKLVFALFDSLNRNALTYFRYPDDIASRELYEYTLMPTHMRDFFQAEEFEGAALTELRLHRGDADPAASGAS